MEKIHIHCTAKFSYLTKIYVTENVFKHLIRHTYKEQPFNAKNKLLSNLKK